MSRKSKVAEPFIMGTLLGASLATGLWTFTPSAVEREEVNVVEANGITCVNTVAEGWQCTDEKKLPLLNLILKLQKKNYACLLRERQLRLRHPQERS